MGYTPQKDTKFTGTETLSNLTSSSGAINLTGSTTVTTPTITIGSSTQKCANDSAVAAYVAAQLVSYATTAQLDAAVAGMDIKASVRVATTAAGTLATSFENGDTVDGQVLQLGWRILIKDQAAPAENGIYVVNASGAPTRATDFDNWLEVPGALVAVETGTTNADRVYLCTADPGGTLNTTSVTFTQFGAGTTYSDGTYLTLTGTVFDLDTSVAMTLGTAQTVTGVKTLSVSASGSTVALGFRRSGDSVNRLSVTNDGSLTWSDSSGSTISALANNSGNMLTSGVWDFTSTAVTVATASAGASTTNVASTAFVQRDSRRKSLVTVSNASFPYIMTASSLLPNADVVVTLQTAAQSAQLPLANAVSPGTIITIKDGSTSGAGTYNITVYRNGGGTDTIDGLTTFTLDTNLQSVDFMSDGTSKWYVV